LVYNTSGSLVLVARPRYGFQFQINKEMTDRCNNNFENIILVTVHNTTN
jgi:hypothetical protein